MEVNEATNLVPFGSWIFCLMRYGIGYRPTTFTCRFKHPPSETQAVAMTGKRGASKGNGAAGSKLERSGKSKDATNSDNGTEPGPPLPEPSWSADETLDSSVQIPRLIKRNLPFFQSRNRVRIEHNQGWKIMSLLRHDLFHVALRYRTSVSLSTLIFIWTLFLIIFAGK
jgi:hypothetical protein